MFDMTVSSLVCEARPRINFTEPVPPARIVIKATI
jgi:hypothetical protein